jgi:hypothetical protein
MLRSCCCGPCTAQHHLVQLTVMRCAANYSQLLQLGANSNKGPIASDSMVKDFLMFCRCQHGAEAACSHPEQPYHSPGRLP